MQTSFEINIGIKSDVGCLRKNNEDYTTYYIPSDPKELQKNGSLFIVADGVGGAAKGEVASRYAADAVLFEYYNNATLPPAERLAFAMQKANREIFQHSQENGNFMRMATTMVAALILNNMLIIAHVGDSRLYLLREGKIQQITRDHSVVAEMVRNGTMTEEEARTSKAKNRLTRSIGGDPEVHVEVSQPIPLNLKDRILICSDGLTRYLDGEELRAAAQEGAVASTAQELVKYARQHGGADNISVILLEVVQKAKRRKLKVVLPPSPEKLGWDEMETEYPPQIPVSERRKIPVWAIGVTAAIILVFSGILLFDRKGNEDKSNTVIPDDTQMLITENENIYGSVVLPTSNPTICAIGSHNDHTPKSPIIDDLKNVQDDTSQTATADHSSIMGDWQCVYHVGKDDDIDTIGEILLKFNISNEQNINGGKDPNSENYYKAYLNCQENDGSYSCSGEPFTYPDPNKINENDWFIVFPYEGDIDNLNFFDHEYCTSHGGEPVEVPQEGGNE